MPGVSKTIWSGNEAFKIAIFGVSASLGLPAEAATKLVKLPIRAMIAGKFHEVRDQNRYNKNKAKLMAKWAECHLNELLTDENINNYIFMTYFKFLQDQICDICDKKIPAIIESDRLMVQMIMSDRRTAKDILQDFQPMQISLDYICIQLCLYEMQYYDKELNVVSLESVTLIREIGTGQFSTEYRVTMQQKDVPQREATLKVMKHSNEESETLDSLKEVECLR